MNGYDVTYNSIINNKEEFTRFLVDTLQVIGAEAIKETILLLKNNYIKNEKKQQDVRKIIDFFQYHNKNLTKEQYNKILELEEIIEK